MLDLFRNRFVSGYGFSYIEALIKCSPLGVEDVAPVWRDVLPRDFFGMPQGMP